MKSACLRVSECISQRVCHIKGVERSYTDRNLPSIFTKTDALSMVPGDELRVIFRNKYVDESGNGISFQCYVVREMPRQRMAVRLCCIWNQRRFAQKATGCLQRSQHIWRQRNVASELINLWLTAIYSMFNRVIVDRQMTTTAKHCIAAIGLNAHRHEGSCHD